MTTTRGEIARAEAGRTNEQLTGKVWLAQNRGEWPVTLLTMEHEVIRWLENFPDGAVWLYEVCPVNRVAVTRPEPYLEAVPESSPAGAAEKLSG